MNIIITGSDGMVGSSLCKSLMNFDYKLLLLGSNVGKLHELTSGLHEYYSYKDISQSEMTNVFENFKPNILIHLAAYSTSSDDYCELEKLTNSNIIYLGKILDALKNTNIQTFVYTGTFAEFYNGDEQILDPAYLYAATKSAGRMYVDYYSKAFNFNYINVIPYTIYGGYDKKKKIIDYLFDSLFSFDPIEVTSGEQVLDFIHVNDIVDLYLKIIQKHELIKSNTFIHAGTGKGNTLKDVVKILENQIGKVANLNWGSKSYRKRDIMHAVAYNKNDLEILGWEAKINLHDGIKLYLSQKNNNYEDTENRN